jgi:hypothetical protein
VVFNKKRKKDLSQYAIDISINQTILVLLLLKFQINGGETNLPFTTTFIDTFEK